MLSAHPDLGLLIEPLPEIITPLLGAPNFQMRLIVRVLTEVYGRGEDNTGNILLALFDVLWVAICGTPPRYGSRSRLRF